MRAPDVWPESDDLSDWQMGAAMRRGAAVCLPHQRVGEAKALARLDEFIAGSVDRYRAERDFPGVIGATSGLSENLALGEIGPRTIWAAGQRALHEGAAGAERRSQVPAAPLMLDCGGAPLQQAVRPSPDRRNETSAGSGSPECAAHLPGRLRPPARRPVARGLDAPDLRTTLQLDER